MPRMDILVTSADERPQLAVEVKNTPQTSSSWAAQLRRNMMNHSAVASTPFFMVAAFDHLFLWRDHGRAAPDKNPDYEVDAAEFLKPYYDRGASEDRVPSPYAMEIVVAGWLRDLVRTEPPKGDKKFAWIVDSGLYEAIRNGMVRTEVPV